ncbi:hypothetical protein NMY22_g3508 [Coprinellus aureogranulatus]|nr:hypothetical protein NMY22_g7737 [Coprinellus aureogranulatus]KAJ3542450.1 hypothetical protein NMY22_g3508 [Coprinellus aureogranulatus]
MSSQTTSISAGAQGPNSSSTAPIKYNPQDWVIVGASPGNLDMAFQNVVDNSLTWYTPEGMTAEEIMQIPTAKNFFQDEKAAQWYIDAKAKEKAELRAKGIIEP